MDPQNGIHEAGFQDISIYQEKMMPYITLLINLDDFLELNNNHCSIKIRACQVFS
jgi:hypothetical protein